MRDIRRLNGQRAARRGIASRALTATFHQHLLELRGVTLNRAHAGRQTRYNLDVFTQGAFQDCSTSVTTALRSSG